MSGISKAVKKCMEEAIQSDFEELDLQDQGIVNIADIPHLLQLRNITTLVLSHNRIVKLPDAIANCQGLENLNLFNNELEMLPTTICNLPKLKFLNCGVNNLRELPKGIGTCPQLEMLDLTYNHLNERSLTRNFFYLQPLRALYLGDNEFVSIPTDIKNLVNLNILVLRDNDIVSLPKEVGELTKLKELHVQGNRLRVLPPEFANLDLSSSGFLLKWHENLWVASVLDQLVLGTSHLQQYLKTDEWKNEYEKHVVENKPPPPKGKTSKKKKDEKKK